MSPGAGWVELDVEPPHRSEAAEDAFRDACQACPHRTSDIDLSPDGRGTVCKCDVCKCPLGWISHRYRDCPIDRVPRVTT